MSFAIFVGNIVLISLRVIPYNTKTIPITLKLILSVPFIKFMPFSFRSKCWDGRAFPGEKWFRPTLSEPLFKSRRNNTDV